MNEVWIQIIITVGAVVGTVFGAIKYMSSQNTKRERQLQVHNEKMQEMQYEYYETKNGHMERMAKDFTNSSNKMASAVNKLSAEIKVLSSKRKK